ncbi:Erp29 [Symbiodinium pilosum]|uniref:Erp29 protein n=1 Tax=Symbiodinium pilosum TaxID=2952 RepID=A0A812MY97_SYMPI|nr:Erp29 [Symbiodinium pilosum]
MTMDKMLSVPGQSFLVKIDEPYSRGEKGDMFRMICQLAYAVPNFFAAEVPVQRFNQKENDDVRERFNLTLKDFPAFYLFTDGSTDGVRYTDAAQAANMIKWLRSRGILMPSIDTIDELDEVVNDFLSEPSARHIEKAKELERKYTNDAKAPMYVKIMEKCLAQGASYAADEIARVMKILQGKVHPQKRAELSDKLKVLKVFAKMEACDVFQCPEGYHKKFGAAGIIGSDAQTCCKPPCIDTEGDEHDAQGHHCDYYDERTAPECGDWDTGAFRASRMCCACGGGHVKIPEADA